MNQIKIKNNLHMLKVHLLKQFQLYLLKNNDENKDAGIALVTVISVVACNKFLITPASWELAIYKK